MSATPFHPAVRGILEAALTEHQQAANLARLAGGAEDSVARLDDIAEGLSRVIVAITPATFAAAPIDGIEKMQRSHAAAGRLIAQLSDYAIDRWEIRPGEVDAMFHSSSGGNRISIRAIAERLGIAFSEQPHSGEMVLVAAEGEVDGLEVRIWCLLRIPPAPVCHAHDLLLVDDVCEQCENPGVDLTPAAVQDEDQPTPQPAAPTCGHGQDEEPVLMRAKQLLENDDPDEDDELAALLELDDDAPVSHSLKPGTSDSRCGDIADVYSNRPTCPTCRSLLRAERRGTTTPPTGDRT